MTSTAPDSATIESASTESAAAAAALQPGSHVLVTGAAGYVGSVCATVLLEQGYRVTVVDDLSTGNRDAIPQQAEFVEGDIRELAEPVLSGSDISVVFHFAARSLVGESVEQPAAYWHHNVVTSL